ncbi:hypothetical protein D3C81_1664580 [compost metagenome]
MAIGPDTDRVFELLLDWSPTAERLNQLYTDTEYRLVAFGHHHVVHHFHAGETTFFNPGGSAVPIRSSPLPSTVS